MDHVSFGVSVVLNYSIVVFIFTPGLIPNIMGRPRGLGASRPNRNWPLPPLWGLGGGGVGPSAEEHTNERNF